MMSGLYLHIPFCKRRCIYCDFYSSTQGKAARRRFVDALCREIKLRQNYLSEAHLSARTTQLSPLRTIYFGGGTPSQLEASELREIFATIAETFSWEADAEITLEANPDDLTPTYIQALSELPVNRLSLGVQSFDDRLLTKLERRHTAQQAEEAVRACVEAGFGNISIDLIYGLPGQSLADWSADLERALSLPVTHLSAYALTYEEGTRLWQMREAHRVKEADEDLSLQMFRLLNQRAAEADFEHYEISNFARHGWRSRHNSSYWQGVPYLGCGPSAHSFDGRSRQWNDRNLTAYLEAEGDVEGGGLTEREELTADMRYDELVMTSLRTCEGLSLERLRKDFGEARLAYALRCARPHIEQGQLELDEDKQMLRLTEEGIFLSDGIIVDMIG